MSRKTISQAYRRVFRSEDADAKRVLADLMMVCGVYDTVAESDPIKLGMIQGARNVALHIAAQLNYKESDFADHAEDDENIIDGIYSYKGDSIQ